MVSIDDMDKFEQKEMKKKRPIKNTWNDWLIDYIPGPTIKGVGGFKDKIVSLFKTNTPKQTVWGRGKKLSKPKTQNIRSPFILKNKKKIKLEIFENFLKQRKKKKKERNQKKKEVNNRLSKDRIIRDIKTLFEREEKSK